MTAPKASKRTFTVERTLKASPEKVWRMWTTKEGLEAWWGPDGFRSVVHHLEVRVGGRFEVVMTAFVPEIVAHLKAGGMGASHVVKGEYTEVVVNRLLVYANAVDFVPGVAPYTATTRVEFSPVPGGTRLAVTNDVMHDEMWTQRARTGWEQEIGKLEKALG